MKRTWSPDELAARWTLTDAERQPLPGRVDHNRLRFAAHLTCFAHEARFPESPRDIPAAALNALRWSLRLVETSSQPTEQALMAAVIDTTVGM